jgi:hypothetical protein
MLLVLLMLQPSFLYLCDVPLLRSVVERRNKGSQLHIATGEQTGEYEAEVCMNASRMTGIK